jgi:hypothetical protein
MSTSKKTSGRKTLSRSQKLLNHLLRGRTISGTQALRMFGIYRLSAVIHNWRGKGFTFETKMITRNGNRYGTYKLTGTPKA